MAEQKHVMRECRRKVALDLALRQLTLREEGASKETKKNQNTSYSIISQHFKYRSNETESCSSTVSHFSTSENLKQQDLRGHCNL